MWSYLFRAALAILLLLPATARAQVSGCTDPLALNYNSAATKNDGSCTYAPTSVTPVTLGQLADTIQETSGLLYWNGKLWTHNDDSDTTLYSLDTADGHILGRVAIAGAANHDWEDLAQDDSFFYIGDFGNNVNGNRQDLVILRIPKAALLGGSPRVTPDKIFFSYADQSSFSPTGNNNTDFDCEAFIATNDSLYLFTKQWVSGKTKLYALPNKPGNWTAQPKTEYNIDGLVAGACYLPAKKTVVLTGYKISFPTLQPFVCLLYDFSNRDFLSGNKRKIQLSAPYHQTEAIASTDGRSFYLSNERFANIITVPPKLMRIDLAAYLGNWYGSLGLSHKARPADSVVFYPNPAGNQFTARVRASSAASLRVNLYDGAGRSVGEHAYRLMPGDNAVQVDRTAGHPSGSYVVRLSWEGRTAWGRITLRD